MKKKKKLNKETKAKLVIARLTFLSLLIKLIIKILDIVFK